MNPGALLGSPKVRAWRMVEIALRAGCRVTSVDEEAGACMVEVPSEQAKVELLNEAMRATAELPLIASAALQLQMGRTGPRRERDIAARIVDYVQTHVAWVDEPGERFQLGDVTLVAKTGDCDCHAILVGGLLLASGIEAEACGITDEPTGDPRQVSRHACTRAIFQDGNRVWCETSVRVPMGTDPRALRGVEVGTVKG